jgi:hypothetical protein
LYDNRAYLSVNRVDRHYVAKAPSKADRHFRRNELRRLIRAKLRGGPVKSRVLIEHIMARRSGMPFRRLYMTVHKTLLVMRAKGHVRHPRTGVVAAELDPDQPPYPDDDQKPTIRS